MGEKYPIIRRTVYPLVKLYIKSIEGIENLNKEGGYIVAANHASYIDDLIFSTIVMFNTHKQIYIFVKDKYFKNVISKVIVEHGKCIPVYTDKNEKSIKLNGLALKKAGKYLRDKEIIGIFPEGTRSPDGKLKIGKTGVAKLALKEKVPVVPFGIKGSFDILPRNAIFPRFKRCKVKIGKPLYFDKFYGKNDKKTYEEVTRIVMKEIAKLVGQEYKF